MNHDYKMLGAGKLHVFFFFALFFYVQAAHAQHLLVRNVDQSFAVGLETRFTQFDIPGSSEFDIPTSTWFPWAKIPVGDFGVMVDWPYSWLSSTFIKEFRTGNPYLGAYYNFPTQPIEAHFGVRLPFGQDFAALAGAVANFQNLELFFEETFTIEGALKMYFPLGNKFKLGGQFQFSRLHFDSVDENLILVSFSPELQYQHNKLSFILSWQNRISSNDDVTEDTYLTLTNMDVAYKFGKAQVYTGLIVPLSEPLSDLIDFSYTLGVRLNW